MMITVNEGSQMASWRDCRLTNSKWQNNIVYLNFEDPKTCAREMSGN